MKKNKQKGFTLVEIIVTLVLVGILAAIAGMGIVQATRSYLFTRDASSMAQKAQAAYARLSKTFINITDVDFTGVGSPSTQLKVTLERNNVEVDETYQFSGGSLTLTSSTQTQSLLDGLDAGSSFFSYFKNDDTAWTPSDDKSDLARIQVNIAMNTSGGQTVLFPGAFVPRNIYRPVDVSDFSSGGDTALPNVGACFISSLYPAKAIGYGPWCIAVFLFLGVIAFAIRRKVKMERLSQRGSALLAIIITMVVMGVLAASMTAMFSSSSIGTVTPSLSNSAYYNAESAYRHVLYTFLTAPEGNKFDGLKNSVNGKTLVLEGNNKADIDIEAFWFVADGNQSNSPTIKVRTPVSFPTEFFSGNSPDSDYLPQSGLLALEEDIDNNPVPYSSVTYNSGDGTLTFTLNSTTRSVSDGDNIYPAFTTSLSGTISEGIDISNINGGSLKSFPRKNGVISLVTNGGGAYILYYEKLSADKTQLMNVKSASNFAALPAGGLQNYGGIDHISLQQNARIRVTGYGGNSSTSLHARRSIEYYQPMIEGTIVTKHEFSDTFDSLDNWKTGGEDEVGDHAIAKVDDNGNESADGDNAMTVSGTETIDDGPASGIHADYYGKDVQESLLLYKPETAGFKDIWDRSDEKLSYDLQVKVSFIGSADNADNNPMGTYMPGIVFRARESETHNNVREYYGLSFVRALFAKDGNGNPQVSNPDEDDIPDQYLFENHGTNDAIPTSVADDVCIANYEPAPQWNDLPPMSGVPYMMLWQQALDFDQWDGLWHRNETKLNVDWLSYVPLCKLTEVTIYHYHAGAIPVPDAVPCLPCDACKTKSWKKYWWDSPVGYGWYPDCCSSRTQTDSGGFFDPWREYTCDTYDCTGGCYNAGCCGVPVPYPEGWYLSSDGSPPFPSTDPRSYDSYTAFRIENHTEYGEILRHEIINVNGTDVEIIGNINNTVNLIRNPSTFDQTSGYRGDPIENAAFIFPNEAVSFQKDHNYRVYLKPWVTVMARIIEMKGDFFDESGAGCGNSEDERINVIQAWFGEPETYPRGEIRWPDESPASFSEMIWPDRGYTSKMDDFTVGSGWGSSERNRRLCDRGEDEYTSTTEKRSPYVYSNQLTSAGYDDYSSNNQPAEVGIHTFGIDATGTDDDHRDRVYFDDFSVRVFEYSQASGVLPGVQSE